MRAAALKPLRPYEPWRDRYGFADPRGQLTLDLLAVRIPPARRARNATAMSPSYVRTIFTAILDARTGRRPLGRLQGLVHPSVYQHLGLHRPLRDVRFTLKGVRLCAVSPDVYEACGTAHTTRRAYAVAGRFERLESGWRCVMFGIVRPPLRRAPG